MIIKKRLYVPVDAEAENVNAVLIEDTGEEYPVFLEALLNTVYFPMLMDSGYKLTSLPYGFTKDGVTMDQLPMERYEPTPQQLDDMFVSIGVKLPMDEIKKHLDIKEAVGLNTPPTAYTIHTREEFLEYLRGIESFNLEEDFKPLNYFVAPEARFTLSEYRAAENIKYIQIIEARRNMTLIKFHSLVKWLQSHGWLGATPSPQDVIDAYFAWGVDGLQFTIINKHKETTAFRLRSNNNVSVAVVRKTQGFIDGAGNLLTPKNERDVVWSLPNKDPDYINELTRGMSVNDTIVAEFRSNATQDLTILEGTQYNVRYTVDTLVMQANNYISLRVKSPVTVGTSIDLSLALPHNIDKLYNFCALQALARMLYDKRKPRVKTSSFDALHVVGANPSTAIQYILTKYGMNKERKAVIAEDEAASIPQYEVIDYLQGREVPESSKLLLDDIINGIFCIDNISLGRAAEAATDIDSVYKELYALHHVMGISLQDLFDKIRNIQETDTVLVFSNGDYQHKVNVTPMKQSINGYKHDVMNYDVQCADECGYFTFVTMVAREVGDETCRRHVGVEFFMANRSRKAVREILEDLVAKYEEKVNNTIIDASKRARALRMKNVFALSRYFEIALKGTITWSKELGAGVERVSYELQNTAYINMETKIESLTTYCDFTVTGVSASNLTFNAYCTNAYITPSYIIPRGHSPIREVPFYSAWMDLNITHPDVYNQLVAMDVLPRGFVSWSSRYMDQQFKQRSMENFDEKDSLYYYYDRAIKEVKEWDPYVEFHSVTHPMDYMFPGLREEKDVELLKVPRQGEPVVRFGLKRDITVKDYADKLYPVEAVDNPEQYIREFSGHSAEAFMLIGSDIFFKYPEENKTPITISALHETIFTTDTNQVLHFTRINELLNGNYPIIHLYGRNYLLRSSDGKLWEARV